MHNGPQDAAAGEPLDGEFSLGDLKPTDFSNPMYDALDAKPDTKGGDGTGSTSSSGGGLYEVPDEVISEKNGKIVREENIYEKTPVGSAVLSPSSVTHRSSPQVQMRQSALNPTTVDTDRDTQQLVEEDKSEC
jgi:low density lipoprotein-related protein 2